MTAPSDRRGVLRALASLPLLSGSVVTASAASAPAQFSAPPDPAFAAIKAAEAAWHAFGKALQVQDEPETEEECDLPQEVADALAREAQELSCDLEDSAFCVTPATPAGLVALLEFWWFANVLDYGGYPEGGERMVLRLEYDREARQIWSLIKSGRAFLDGRRA